MLNKKKVRTGEGSGGRRAQNSTRGTGIEGRRNRKRAFEECI